MTGPAIYGNGRDARVGDEVISALGTTAVIAVIDVDTDRIGWLGYWPTQGTVTEVHDDGTVTVHRSEAGFLDDVGHRYRAEAKHLLVGGDS
jgi:hypothetical protein